MNTLMLETLKNWRKTFKADKNECTTMSAKIYFRSDTTYSIMKDVLEVTLKIKCIEDMWCVVKENMITLEKQAFE